ncbi:hypothetical protein ACROAE_17475 [Shewanella sp. MF05960]|uniref:hypothetical protein n=1 Tax=Shewanella sp. MF05960 TaxID=3434874 RepID=UPI003D7BF7A4
MGVINAEVILKIITETISNKLSDVGLMFRIFSRAKDEESIKRKIDSEPEYGKSKKLQDLIGVRIVLYFNDDIDTVRDIISNEFEERENDVSIDKNKNDEFKATRFNIVYTLGEELEKRLNIGDRKHIIDSTFELQIRTIFSEGWHEVEHDLRYKCKGDWDGFDNESRLLNGVYATLETSEWTMIKIFEEVAYSHYKSKDWPAMFRQKFRLRFTDDTISPEIREIFKNDNELVKRFFRIDRIKLIKDMSRRGYFFPMSIQNIIFFANISIIQNEDINKLVPPIMIEAMTNPII